uniref:Uncharacterized protein n=1 Tax=Candidatus Kentrum sp. LFY TaxID=2126342 RepID=A0A450UD02_9GAMM|nr:MAG: hypothetical protein BECKLFY1418B_GA0070995_100556 [Candidatus Kentron sp. LFY]VFJ90296.1 MAG: hypothetical protein BECKLFY1418A_GA0070994_101113 [Candidatus Kentron sp. LFY]
MIKGDSKHRDIFDKRFEIDDFKRPKQRYCKYYDIAYRKVCSDIFFE